MMEYGLLGTKRRGYTLEIVDFIYNPGLIINYGQTVLTSETTIHELESIFEIKLLDKYGNGTTGTLLGFCSLSDDGLNFDFKNGKLIRIEYWSPC